MVIFLSSLIGLAVLWYIICDRVANTRTNYIFPTNCCGCDSRPGLESYKVSRQWYLSVNEIMDYIFPFAEREVTLPICSNCLEKFEAKKKLANKLAWGVAALSSIPFIYYVYGKMMSIEGSSFIGLALVGLFYLLFAFLIAKGILSYISRFAKPAYFTLFGKLRFRCKSYRQKYTQQNLNPEVYVRKHVFPYHLMLGFVLAICMSVVLDILNILDAYKLDSYSSIVILSSVLVFGEIISMILVLRFFKYGVILWGIIIVAEIFLIPNFNIEEILLAGLLFVIFIYDWWINRV